jgi:putative aldouronate transport system permease protein
MAIVSVTGLYYLVQHWNDFFTGLVFVRDASKQPLQIVLRDILISNQAFAGGAGGAGGSGSSYAQQYADQIKYAVIVVSTLPVIVLYPFLQRYFEKGVMIGAVKG